MPFICNRILTITVNQFSIFINITTNPNIISPSIIIS
nr:MAG TPA: hypothetical protein [Caudoviricetes sp.]